ncbi:MAG: hypothetical protein Q7R88_00930 [bacterium]|nr:hypothetical protein [bacterium]
MTIAGAYLSQEDQTLLPRDREPCLSVRQACLPDRQAHLPLLAPMRALQDKTHSDAPEAVHTRPNAFRELKIARAHLSGFPEKTGQADLPIGQTGPNDFLPKLERAGLTEPLQNAFRMALREVVPVCAALYPATKEYTNRAPNKRIVRNHILSRRLKRMQSESFRLEALRKSAAT